MYLRLIAAFLTVFAVTLFVMPLVIMGLKRLKARQTVLHYVTEHSGKSGIPTMGGVGFILPLFLSLLFSKGESSLLLVTVVVTAGYGVVGFLDDFIKIFFKRNQGLSAAQKLIFQLLIAGIVSFFAYRSQNVGSSISTVLFGSIDLGVLSIPLYAAVFLSLTNAVNLTDGLDGLASGVSVVYLIFFAVLMGLGLSVVYNEETANLVVFCACLAGGLLAFLCFNTYPAKVFMGDTGSLAIGGALACLAIFSGRITVVPILGIVYLVTCMSVIIQVLHYKRTKRRVFLMAPLHHHLQKKGHSESRIGFYYSMLTMIAGCLIVLAYLLKNG